MIVGCSILWIFDGVLYDIECSRESLGIEGNGPRDGFWPGVLDGTYKTESAIVKHSRFSPK